MIEIGSKVTRKAFVDASGRFNAETDVLDVIDRRLIKGEKIPDYWLIVAFAQGRQYEAPETFFNEQPSGP